MNATASWNSTLPNARTLPKGHHHLFLLLCRLGLSLVQRLGGCQENQQLGEMSSSTPPPHDATMSSGQYLATRLSSLQPPMLAAPNPRRLLRSLNRTQWAFFLIAFSAWVCLGRPAPLPPRYRDKTRPHRLTCG